MLFNLKCVFRFPLQPGLKYFHSKSNGAKYDQKCILVLMCSTHYSRQILMKLEFSRQIL
jgi:hypothetical protein